MNDALELVEPTQSTLDIIWCVPCDVMNLDYHTDICKRKLCADYRDISAYPQTRMVHVLKVTGIAFCEFLQAKLGPLSLWTDQFIKVRESNIQFWSNPIFYLHKMNYSSKYTCSIVDDRTIISTAIVRVDNNA